MGVGRVAHYAYRQYQQSQAATASPGELILMLYGGAIKFINKSRLHIEAGEVEGAHKNLIAAQNIVMELMVTVDNSAGPLASNLVDLYSYMYRRLVEANTRKDAVAAEEVAELLRGLNEAWEGVIRRPDVAAKVPQIRPMAKPTPMMRPALASHYA